MFSKNLRELYLKANRWALFFDEDEAQREEKAIRQAGKIAYKEKRGDKIIIFELNKII
jgi:hypothetical protein